MWALDCIWPAFSRLQGQFKRSISCADLLTGQIFVRPLRNLPPRWLQRILVSIASRISPNLRLGPLSSPSILHPLAVTAQCITATRLNNAPPNMGDAPLEDLRALSGDLVASSGITYVPHAVSLFSTAANIVLTRPDGIRSSRDTDQIS